MLEINFVKSISERDIDLLLLEELTINQEFQEWVISRIFSEKLFQTSLGAWHSVSSSLGETDLLFMFESNEGSRIAVLVENKVDASPQPKQAQRYAQRGQEGQKEGHWDQFKTCIFAPEKYLSSSNNPGIFDSELSYEEIFSFFLSRRSRDSRFEYKADILQEAIQKNRRGYQPNYDERMTQFVKDYFAYVEPIYPDLKMQKPKPRPKGSNWIMFYPESFNGHIDLLHQFTAGKAKLLLYSEPEKFEEIKDLYEPHVPDDAVIEFLGKSVSIAFPVDKIDALNLSFQEQLEKIKPALKRIAVLKGIVEKVQEG